MNLKESLELNLDMILDESYYEHESKIFVEDLISYLPSLQRRIIKEKFLYGYSYKKIGDRLNISRQAVNGIKNRALNNLRKLT